MRGLRTIAYVSIAVLVVSMLAIGAVSAKAGYGVNGKMQNDNGVCLYVSTPGTTVQATGLTDEEIEDLQYLREEEKLARDVYSCLYKEWNMPIFNNIAMSEQKQTDAVKSLLDRYGVADPAAETEPGVFTNDELQKLYDQLIIQGKESRQKALNVGVLIEKTDIKDLNNAIPTTTHKDIKTVYSNLLQGSYNHLSAFTKLGGV
jgi:hypothetical protein